MEQNYFLCIVALLSGIALFLLLINRKQRVVVAHLINANDHLKHITTELRRSTKILSIMANVEIDMGIEDETGEKIEQQEAKLYIGNIDYSTTERELERIFSEYGEISNVNIPTDRYNGKARGFGFVTFRSTAEALKAMELNGTEIKGRTIQVNFAKERDNLKNMSRAG